MRNDARFTRNDARFTRNDAMCTRNDASAGAGRGIAMVELAMAPPVSSIETEVVRIRGLMQANQFAAALSAGNQLLTQVPENRDVLYVVAVSQRYLGRITDALDTLMRFEKIHPRYSRLFQERGHCYIAARNPGAAMEAYLAAVNINVALPASWQALQVLFRSAGRAADADTAAAHVATLAKLPVEVVTATSMFADGEIHEAEHIVRQYLLTHGNHVEAMRLLAKIGMKLDVLADAEFLLESVLVLAPGYQAARYDYVLALLARHKHVRALEELDKLLEVDPRNRSYKTTYATACVGLGDTARALQLYRELLEGAPQAADLHLSIAHVLKTQGRQTEAIDEYRTAAACRHNFGDAYWSLANLKTYQFPDDEIAQMRAAEAAAATPLVDRYHLCFAIGKALEDRGEYAESFAFYERGNALKKGEIRFRIEPLERSARLQTSVCTRSFFASRQGSGSPDPAPIFIVGLPRAGSTLLEQILASHSKVEGTMELSDIPRLVQELQGWEYNESLPRYPGVLAELGVDRLKQLGDKYLAGTAVYRSGRPFFIDKMPNNFRHIGFIHLILPNAKIIDARREPMACCFSNFKQLFAAGQEFTYSIDDIARYYRTYVQLMDHWNSVLPGRILQVQHEDVVEDLEGNVRRLLDFCGLDFEPACLEFYKTERSIRTASSEQVRRPIFKEGLDQWRHFEPWLGPLKVALGDLVVGSVTTENPHMAYD
jgi:tetratricopeptide (TPR) repeat protein